MRAVLFDLDGTLLDTLHLIELSFHYATRTVLGHDVSMDAFKRRFGEPLPVQMAEYADTPEQIEELAATYRAHNATIMQSELKEFPGIMPALKQLHMAGWKMGVVTSKRHDTAYEHLDWFDMMPYFSCLIGADDVVKAKPHPEPVLMAAAALEVSPETCFYVGDSPYDIQSANDAGAVSVAVHWGQHPVSRLREAEPALECIEPEDLPGLVAGYGK